MEFPSFERVASLRSAGTYGTRARELVTHAPRSAILLAAGCARRLKHLTADRPKCLLEVGGRTLIEHQIAALAAGGVRDVVVVTGYRAEQVEALCGATARFVRNPVFDTPTSLYSLHLALQELNAPRAALAAPSRARTEPGDAAGGFVLTNADVLFHPELLARLLKSPHPDALLYEPSASLGDEEMKVRVVEG